MSAGLHLDGLTGEPSMPYQSQTIRLGLIVMPDEMVLFYLRGNNLDPKSE